MGIGVSLVLIAIGAILTWAINATVSGVDVNAVGVILMIVGAVGLLLSLMFWSSWGGYGVARNGGGRRVTTIEEGPPPPPGSDALREKCPHTRSAAPGVHRPNRPWCQSGPG